MKILIVEDERSLHEVIRKTLEAERFVVESAFDYKTALFKTADYSYDCVLLDLGLPGGSGFSILEELKHNGKGENIIIISARDSIEDKIKGLDMGADDYLAKPFHIAELVARVRSVTRRKDHSGTDTICYSNVTIRPSMFEVMVGDIRLDLLRKEYDLLYYFMMRPGHTVSKDVIAESVWGDYMDDIPNFDFLYAQIKNLRQKLVKAGAMIEIKSVYGIGYKLCEL